MREYLPDLYGQTSSALPTKEFVFLERADRLASPSYKALMAREQRFWERTQAFLNEHGIDSVDALAPLREQLAHGPQPYPVTVDGHPTEHGHRAIARAVQAHLEARGRSPRDQR